MVYYATFVINSDVSVRITNVVHHEMVSTFSFWESVKEMLEAHASVWSTVFAINHIGCDNAASDLASMHNVLDKARDLYHAISRFADRFTSHVTYDNWLSLTLRERTPRFKDLRYAINDAVYETMRYGRAMTETEDVIYAAESHLSSLDDVWEGVYTDEEQEAFEEEWRRERAFEDEREEEMLTNASLWPRVREAMEVEGMTEEEAWEEVKG